jgi:hypothetical protein
MGADLNGEYSGKTCSKLTV